MIRRWWRARRERRVLEQRPIPDALWRATVAAHPFLAALSPDEAGRLHALATLFLADKEFSAAGGLEITDAMAVSIAAQACLPVLELGLDLYRGFVGIVVHPDEVVARRSHADEIGVVHEYDEPLVGEAVEGGPVMLSWRDVAEAGASAEQGYNVVIHEFCHVIDMADGAADGVPPLRDAAAHRHWRLVVEAGHERLCRQIGGGQSPFLDPYGAESVEEFFPVAAEAFFVAPRALRDEQPQLYELFVGYFGQDPAARIARP
ncbi:MAG TPA: M90 family metallopeptidase [Methylibium sp.]|uniref:M90 family metallopeptidase n=1 Tax=Methylibium sp. TaxID=2067992 RepID=UPI002DB55D18|nr:M90 family metallopeptidase [Methylibium sp.]HEU4458912.1 M90 family metallopeptidase [Methylibium sp.]